jgi:alpha-beta hydrolase superfamily lysophospholipase
MNVQNKIDWKKISEQESISHFESSQDKQNIYIKKWHARSPIEKGKVIFLLHDLCQYHGRFESLIHWYQDQDPSATFVSMDFVGHGLSSGTRGHFDHLDFLVKDLLYMFQEEKKESNDSWYVLAHGLGGLTILSLLNKYPNLFEKKIDGLILSNFILNFKQNSLSKLLSTSISKYQFGSRIRGEKVFDSHHLTCDLNEMIIYDQDSLVSHRPTQASLLAIKTKMKNINRDAYFLDWPVLVLYSSNDYYQGHKNIEYFLKGIKKNLLTEKNYSNLKHDLYNERDKLMVFNDLFNWINNNEKIS